jgi:thioredoxin 1
MVNAESGVVLVDFYASWCGPCRTQAKVLQDAAPSLSGVTIVKVDVDAAPGLSSKFNVSSIPTLIVFKSGEQVAKQVGLTEGNALKSMIAKAK